jgi:hypothetical protein
MRRCIDHSSFPICRVEGAEYFQQADHLRLLRGWHFRFHRPRLSRLRLERPQSRVITQDILVSNLFPASIRDRLNGIGDRVNGGNHNDSENSSMGGSSAQASKQLIDFGDGGSPAIYGSRPLADLFLETTVLFADIAGFTAWSSAREPSQVFTLLENIYGKFHLIRDSSPLANVSSHRQFPFIRCL